MFGIDPVEFFLRVEFCPILLVFLLFGCELAILTMFFEGIRANRGMVMGIRFYLTALDFHFPLCIALFLTDLCRFSQRVLLHSGRPRNLIVFG